MSVEIHDLIKVYQEHEVPALRGIELSVSEGEFVGIIGPSGAGKTTLLAIIGGFLEPTSGSVYVDETYINTLKGDSLIKFRQQTIGFLWQMPEDNLFNNISVMKNVMLPMQLSNKPREQQKKTAEMLLDKLELSHRRTHKPNQLSGGEAQRASIAVALANEPKILLGDQITGELDSDTSQITVDYLRDLNQELGTTMIIATHKKQFMDCTDHSFEIKDGRITKLISSQVIDDKEILTRKRQEYIYVDFQGNLRLPEEILKKVPIEGLVKAEVENGIIKIILVKKQKKKNKSRKKEK
ncbi:MAG: ABC transporter ATP-binding protein [Asgard group archaeon]|nr:ABC transporter ATP-binding protein [Asgard group archaeon]